jgi:glycosyltransferase involved in cell wall biosynthesis
VTATLVIPTFNGAKMLGEAIESGLAQDYDPLEIIVVDDGSTDTTEELVRSFASVRYVRQANAGPSAARNRGIRLATGEFVGFLDADDLAPPTKMSVQVGYLQRHSDVGCVLGRHELVGDPPTWFDVEGVPLISLVTRRSLLLEIGGFDTTLAVAEDRDLLVRLREAGARIEFLSDIVLTRRFHGENLSFGRPAGHPVFRSLKGRLDRSRAEGGHTG